MDAPVISIYDMLKKRYRQQRKEEQLQIETFPADGRRPIFPTRNTEVKKLKAKASRTKVAATPKEKSTKMASNVVTATHLTKKRSGMLMPAVAKKEVLHQLIERMTLPTKKSDVKLILSNESSSSTGLTLNTVIKKVKPLVPVKPKMLKAKPGSASSQSRRRLALSPRNTNVLATAKQKRAKPQKLKTSRKSEATNSATVVRPKRRLQSGKSKCSIHTKSSLEDNVVRYRL